MDGQKYDGEAQDGCEQATPPTMGRASTARVDSDDSDDEGWMTPLSEMRESENGTPSNKKVDPPQTPVSSERVRGATGRRSMADDRSPQPRAESGAPVTDVQSMGKRGRDDTRRGRPVVGCNHGRTGASATRNVHSTVVVISDSDEDDVEEVNLGDEVEEIEVIDDAQVEQDGDEVQVIEVGEDGEEGEDITNLTEGEESDDTYETDEYDDYDGDEEVDEGKNDTEVQQVQQVQDKEGQVEVETDEEVEPKAVKDDETPTPCNLTKRQAQAPKAQEATPGKAMRTTATGKKIRDKQMCATDRSQYKALLQKGEAAARNGELTQAERYYCKGLQLYDGDDALTLRLLALYLQNGVATMRDFHGDAGETHVCALAATDDVIVID